MTAPLHIDLTVEDLGSGVWLVAGIPGQAAAEVGLLIGDDGAVRTLWPTRGLPARLPERPLGDGPPSLSTILRGVPAAPTEEV